MLPLVFAIHDGEELLTMPGWLASHREVFEASARGSELASRIVESLPTSTTQIAIAIAAVAALVVTVTAGAAYTRRPGIWLYAYSTVLGLLFLHVFTHVAQAVVLRSYVPGLVGAVLVVLPGALYIYRRLVTSRLLTIRAAVVTALVGLVLFLPGVLALFSLARWLFP